MENIELSEDELEVIELEKERLLWREFWTYKYGGVYPTRIEKVVKKMTFEEDNRERDALNKEFEDFVKIKRQITDVNRIFTAKVR